MKSKTNNFETLFLLIICTGAFLLSYPDLQTRLLNNLIPSIQWEAHANALTQLFVLYGTFVLIILIWKLVFFANAVTLVSKTRMLFGEAAAFIREEQIPALQEGLSSFQDVAWVVIAVLIAIFVRAYFLSQPIRYDEAYTFLRFVNNGFADLFYYLVPNNHVLHTLLVKLSTLVWGNSPVSIRMPAFFAGILSIPFLYFLCRSMQVSGIFAALMAATSPYLILFSTNGRGYTLLVLFTIILALIGAQISRRGASAAGSFLLSAAAALGMFIMPSMLFPIAGIFAWVFCLLLIKGQSFKTVFYNYVIPTGFMTFVFTIILYTPVIIVSNGFEAVIANKYVQPDPWPLFINRLYPHLQNTLETFFRDIPLTAQYASLILLLIGFGNAFRKQNWGMVLILPLLIFGSAIILFIQHAIPFQRTWIFMLPFIFLYVDSGLSFIVEKIPANIRKVATGFIFTCGAVFAISLMSTNAINKYVSTGIFPEAPIIAGYLSPLLHENDTVISILPADYPLDYYLWTDHVETGKTQSNNQFGRTFFVVQNSQFSLGLLTRERVIKILDFGDASVYQTVDFETR